MVTKGLKVGEVFEDGGRKYKVTKVNPDGSYESTTNFIEEETPKRTRKTKE